MWIWLWPPYFKSWTYQVLFCFHGSVFCDHHHTLHLCETSSSPLLLWLWRFPSNPCPITVVSELVQVYHHVKQRSWNWRFPTAQLLFISIQLSLLTSVHALLWSGKGMDPLLLEEKFHECRISPIYIYPTEFPRPWISERQSRCSIYRFFFYEWTNEWVCGSSLYHDII